jgi:putative two-component system response regulator
MIHDDGVTFENIILIVDDIAENRRLLATTIQKHTRYAVRLASDGAAVLKAIERELPDLILLDIMMPGMDGYMVSKALKNNPATKDIPIIFLTAMADMASKVKAFELGGVDYITKPFHEHELLARIHAQIRLKNYQDHLNYLVEEKTRKIEDTTIGLVNALENANFYNDTDTGNHIRRVSEYSAFLAEQYGCDADFVKRIRLYASLHDVGKVGLPDAILKKPGKYTDEEFRAMQQHVMIGARMLESKGIDPMAKNVALYHHERWDGAGYVHGLAGEAIPLEARLVAIADVYDALVTKRVYKKAFEDEDACRLIHLEIGKHFDPRLAELFLQHKTTILKIKKYFT